MAEQRQDGRFLNSLKQPFRHKGKDYVVKITPARIEEKDGSEKEYYPSWREELVEEALKKLACDQLNGVYLNGVAGVQFTVVRTLSSPPMRTTGAKRSWIPPSFPRFW